MDHNFHILKMFIPSFDCKVPIQWRSLTNRATSTAVFQTQFPNMFFESAMTCQKTRGFPNPLEGSVCIHSDADFGAPEVEIAEEILACVSHKGLFQSNALLGSLLFFGVFGRRFRRKALVLVKMLLPPSGQSVGCFVTFYTNVSCHSNWRAALLLCRSFLSLFRHSHNLFEIIL